MKAQLISSSVGAVVLPVLTYFYGSGDAVVASMVALLFFICMDWLSGIRAAKKDNTYASKYGIDGVFRTFFLLLLPAGGHLLDAVMRSPGVIYGMMVAGLLYHIIQSMTANAVRAGWADWMPVAVLDWILKWVGSELEKKMQRAESRKVGEQ
ncbi:phage holin family protein [Gorillibacterium timonense]|uniref:phage holin family protein n=1 Tax=Gorillibacterium timonense TaxID=1689269 RepID=UPI00071E3247|nr:phage holin family protein [Gorillibacterium timonense]